MGSIVGLFGSSMTMGLVIVAFVIGLVVMWYIRGLFGTKNVVRSSALLTAVKKVNEMVTLRSYFQHVIEDTQKTDLIIMSSDSKLLMVCKGEIICHFDMSKAKINLNEENKHVNIKMYNCELQTIIDTKNVRVYDSTRGVFDFIADTLTFKNTYDFNNVRDILEKERPAITEEAKNEWHLIEKAKDNARQILKNLVNTFGYTAEVSFNDD